MSIRTSRRWGDWFGCSEHRWTGGRTRMPCRAFMRVLPGSDRSWLRDALVEMGAAVNALFLRPAAGQGYRARKRARSLVVDGGVVWIGRCCNGPVRRKIRLKWKVQEVRMKMNRRRWFARAAACASTSSAFEFQLRAQSSATLHLPARQDFPMAETAAFLNNAAWHPLSSGALGAIQAYLQRKSTGSTRFSFAPAGDQVKALIAKLIHAQPSSISFVPSTTVGENLVVQGLGFPQSRGNIVTDALHYENSTYLYRSLKAQGLDVRFVKPRKGRIELADMERAIDRGTKLVAISLVSYLNGFQYDLKAVCDLAHGHGAYVYADLVQAAGSVPIDVEGAKVDFAGGGSHKWLMGDMGLGYLYVREDLLDTVIRRTQFGSRQVTAFENHVFPYDLTADGAATWNPLRGAAAHFEVGTISQATV